MPPITGFFAYPADPPIIGETIESAIGELKDISGNISFQSWKENDIAGRFIAEQVLNAVAQKDALIADISVLNFNVMYEIGFGIGKGKRLLLTKNSAVIKNNKEITELGIVDTLGYHDYQNSHELATFLRTLANISPLETKAVLNRKAPVYLIDAKYKTDPVIRIISRVKKARLFYRSFDPNEQPRLSAHEAIQNVAQSYGVLVHLVPSSIADARIHNLRSAFLAGLAEGMGKVLLFLQNGDEPVPLDFRDLVKPYHHPNQIDEAIAEFANLVTEAWQGGVESAITEKVTLLDKLNLGASSAENELRDLGAYYLETDAYQRALRGDVRIVVGRKGSGKTAIFAQVRDYVRRNKANIVLDLKPDGYKLLKFKESILRLLEEGTLEHTIMAFWEYLLLLEICHKIIEKDKGPHTIDHRLYKPYRELDDSYKTDEYVTEGDFSERMSKLIQTISTNYKATFSEEHKTTLSQAQVTELLYMHDVAKLRTQVENYLKFKDSLWLLFDNIDKGWPTHGIQREDLVIIRELVEASRKIERQMQRHDIDCHTLIFIRNDVYELLVQETPDRGKEAKVGLDWTDSDLLRELLRRRLVFNGLPKDQTFEEIWHSICISHIDGEESSQFFIERSLMRPRCLIDLINHCRSFAVNLKHNRIDHDDVKKGLAAYSTDLIFEIGLEIRDILPRCENILYEFIGSRPKLTPRMLEDLLKDYRINAEQMQSIVDILLWFGVLGVTQLNGEIAYIYSVNYDMNLLKGIIKKLETTGLAYTINPAFWAGLGIA